MKTRGAACVFISVLLFSTGMRGILPDDGQKSTTRPEVLSPGDQPGRDGNSVFVKGQTYYIKGKASYDAGNIDSALWYFDRAYERYDPDTQKLEIAHVERMRAMAYWNRGLYSEALTHIDEALWRYEELKKPRFLLAAYNTKGTILWGLSNYKAAMEQYTKALYLYESEGNDNKGHILRYINNIGMVYYDWGDNENAMKYFKQAEEMIAGSTDSVGIAYTWLNLGTYYLDKDEPKAALGMLKKAKNLYLIIRDYSGVCLCDIRIGQSYSKEGNYHQAENFFLEAIRRSEEHGNKNRNASARFHLAENDLLQGHYDQALKNSLISLEISRSEKYKELSSMLYGQLSSLYEKQGNMPLALDMLKKEVAIQEEINKEKIEVQHNILDLAIKNQVRENENKQLRKENQLNQKTIYLQYIIVFLVFGLLIVISVFYLKMGKKKKELQKAIWVKDKIFSIVAHDLRSPVGTLSNIVEILVDDTIKIDHRLLLNEYKPVMTASFTMLDNLLVWAKANLGKIDASPVLISLNMLIKEIMVLFSFSAGQKSISVVFKPGPEVNVLADRILLETILRNLLNNAIKFTDTGGTIRIEVAKGKNVVKISLTDNGIGIPVHAQSTVLNGHFHSYGTRNEKGSGIGLMLCRELAALNGGDLWFTSKEGKGSTFSFSVPLAQG